MIVNCGTCKPHSFQDERYGPRKRVANETKDPEKVRCTVCKSLINPKTQTVTWSFTTVPNVKT